MTILTCKGIILYPNKGEAKKKLPILKEAKPTPARIFRRLESSKPGSISEKARLSILPYIRNSIKNKHKVICQTN